ncbi:MAG: type II toxin-antitoxin system RelE/ParE family toxin [Thermoguttaceae bacterium]
MEITYANRQIEKVCTEYKKAQKELGTTGSKVLVKRLQQLRFVESLEELRFQPGHFHELSGERLGQLAVRLEGVVRLVFRPAHPPPIKADGGLNWSEVTSVELIEIVDYH